MTRIGKVDVSASGRRDSQVTRNAPPAALPIMSLIGVFGALVETRMTRIV